MLANLKLKAVYTLLAPLFALNVLRDFDAVRLCLLFPWPSHSFIVISISNLTLDLSLCLCESPLS